MVNLLKSKKGGIPAINEIVMTFLNITPKPILALIFILLITTISGFVIPILLNTFGYSCVERGNNDIELYQVPMTNIVQKSALDITRGLSNLVGIEEYSLPENPFPNGNKAFLRIPEQCFVSVNINGSDTFGYSGGCVNCDLSGNFLSGFFTPTSQRVCVSDGTEPRDYLSANRQFCSQCSPPYPYYYNHSVCINSTECYFTIEDINLIQYVDESFILETDYKTIIGLDGVLRPQSNSEIINIQCTQNKRPSLYFFSIELFNRIMWIMLLVGFAIVTFALHWYNVVLK